MKKDNMTNEQLLDEISKLKNKVAKLEKSDSEERYKGIVQSTASCIVVYKAVNNGKDFIIEDFNPMAEKVEKISKEKVIGKKVTEVFPGVVEFGLFKVFQNVWKTGKPKHFPVLLYQDKRIQGYRENYIYKLSSGEIVAVYQDLTDRKQADEALKESESRFKSIFSEAPIGIEYYNSEGSLINVNQKCLKIFGVDDIKEIKGFKLFEDPNLSEESIKQVKEGKPYQYETEFDFDLVKKHKLYKTSKSGKCFMNILITPYEILDIGEKGYLVHIEDINDRKQAEETIRESEASLRVAQQLANIGDWQWNVATNVVQWSEELCRINGYDPNLPVPSFAEMSSFYTPESWKRLNEVVTKAFNTGEAYELELDLIRTDGILRQTLARGTVDYDANGKIVRLHGTVQDITKRKQTEAALLSSENLLNATQQLTKVGGWEWNVENQTMFWTDETYRIHEIDPTEIELGSGKHIESGIKCYDEKDRQIIMEAFQKCVDEGISYDLEFPFTTVKGNRIWIRTTAQAEKENDKVVVVIGNIMNITERKQAEEALKESEEKYRSLVETIDEGIGNVDKNETFTFLNQAAADIFGYPQKEMIGKNLKELTSPEMFQKVLEQSSFRKKGKSSFYELSIIRKNGEQRIITITATPIISKNGEHQGSFGIFHDITERKQAEEQLKESEEKYRLLATNTLDTIWTTDIEFNMNFVNSAIINFLGYTPEEFIGLKPSVFTTNESMKTIKNAAEQLVIEFKRGKLNQSRFEVKQIKKDGSIIDVEIRANLLLDSDKKFIGFQGRSVDITERKQAGKEIKEKSIELKKQFDISEKQRIATSVIMKDLSKTTKVLKAEIVEHNKAEVELKKKISELEIFNAATVDRELKINDLRKEINELLKKLGRKEKYKIVT